MKSAGSTSSKTFGTWLGVLLGPGRDLGIFGGSLTSFGLEGGFRRGFPAFFTGIEVVDLDWGIVGGTSGVEETSIISASARVLAFPGGSTGF